MYSYTYVYFIYVHIYKYIFLFLNDRVVVQLVFLWFCCFVLFLKKHLAALGLSCSTQDL